MGTHPIFESDFDCLTDWIEIMTHQNEIKLLLYDYQLVGTTMGTHSAVVFNSQEYWYSITGLRKRNRRTGTVFNFNENLKKWEQDQGGSDDIVSVVDHFTRSIKNLGSISSHSKRPRQVIHCGITRMSEGGLERNIKSFINVEFSSLNYNLETMNCNTFSRFLIQYLDPSEKEDALNALREVIFQTAQTANNIESGIREIKDNVCDFVANNGPLVVMGAAAATSFILKKMFG